MGSLGRMTNDFSSLVSSSQPHCWTSVAHTTRLVIPSLLSLFVTFLQPEISFPSFSTYQILSPQAPFQCHHPGEVRMSQDKGQIHRRQGHKGHGTRDLRCHKALGRRLSPLGNRSCVLRSPYLTASKQKQTSKTE